MPQLKKTSQWELQKEGAGAESRAHLQAKISKGFPNQPSAVSNQRQGERKDRYFSSKLDDSLKKGKQSCCNRRLMSN